VKIKLHYSTLSAIKRILLNLFDIFFIQNERQTDFLLNTEHWSRTMSRVCQVTGKRPITGNNVSHANNKTRRRFLPNIQHKRFWVEEENRFVSLKVSARGIRTIDKLGIKVVLDQIRANGEKV